MALLDESERPRRPQKRRPADASTVAVRKSLVAASIFELKELSVAY